METDPANHTQANNSLQNFIVVGSVGAGKSSTCNTICGSSDDNIFSVNHDVVSCETHTASNLCESKGIILYDTPGFGDPRLNEQTTDNIIRQIASTIFSPIVESTGNERVDAFLLVVKFDQHSSTLRKDLEHLFDLFGPSVFKSLILLPIMVNQEKSPEVFLQHLFKDKEALKMLQEGKGEESNPSWFCLWDNFNPPETQEEELLKKVRKLEPYTVKKFNDFLNDEKEINIEEILSRTPISYAKEDILAEKSMMKVWNLLKIRTIISENKNVIEQYYSTEMRKSLEVESSRLFEELEKRNTVLYSDVDVFVKQNRQALKMLKESINKGENPLEEENEEEMEDIIWSLLKTKSKTEQKEKTRQLTETVAKMGVEKLAEKGTKTIMMNVVRFASKKICNIF